MFIWFLLIRKFIFTFTKISGFFFLILAVWRRKCVIDSNCIRSHVGII